MFSMSDIHPRVTFILHNMSPPLQATFFSTRVDWLYYFGLSIFVNIDRPPFRDLCVHFLPETFGEFLGGCVFICVCMVCTESRKRETPPEIIQRAGGRVVAGATDARGSVNYCSENSGHFVWKPLRSTSLVCDVGLFCSSHRLTNQSRRRYDIGVVETALFSH